VFDLIAALLLRCFMLIYTSVYHLKPKRRQWKDIHSIFFTHRGFMEIFQLISTKKENNVLINFY